HGSIDPVSFLREKTAEREAMRAKTHTWVFVTEPNVKNGAGGLRDLHQVLWLLGVMHHVDGPMTPPQLEAIGVLSSSETAMLMDALDFLLRVRNWLHLTVRKREETLMREYHERIATDLGFTGDGRTGVAAFFKRFYDVTAFVYRFAVLVEQQLLDKRVTLNDEFYAENQRLYVRTPKLLERNPQVIMTAFELAQRYGFELSVELRESIRTALNNADVQLCTADGAGRIFMRILEQPNCHTVLEEMVELGVLQAFVPELGRAMTFVPANRAHELTVGAHCLQTVANIADLERTAGRAESLLGEVWREVTDRGTLLLAALLHDLGKVASESEHCEVGAQIAAQIADRIGLDSDRRNSLIFLVRNHLLLLRTARLYDTQDEETIAQVAEQVGDAQLLRMLYLLSYADARAVSNQTFTEIEAELLDLLFINVNRYLQERSGEALREAARERWAHVSRRLKRVGVRVPRMEELAASLPTGYLLNTPPETIAEHLQLIQQVHENGRPVIVLHNDLGVNFTEMTVCAYDDPEPGMLSKICGTLYAHDVDIRMAQVFTVDSPCWQAGVAEESKHRIVVDTLRIRTKWGQVSEARGERIRNTLEQVLTGQLTVAQLLAEAGMPTDVPVRLHEVRISNDISKTRTVIYIRADDRKGLLYCITTAIATLGLDIITAKIATWRDVAEDSFYVIDRAGNKVPNEDIPRLEGKLKELLQR
ncbi:MAG TPA: HD domain-containing protein, partial [Armatimonadetes bacterium]|nr:HD domain-containing protein [Armatimonadota bacterium]